MSENYRNIEIIILEKYFKHLILFNPILGQISSYKKIHPGGFHYAHNDKELNTELKAIESVIELKYDDILNFNFDAFCEQIYSYAKQRLDQIEESIFNSVSEVSELTGNVVDNRGKPITAELLLQLLEKLELSFDEEGKFHIPSLVVSPETMKEIKKIEAGEDYQKKYLEIIEKKRKQYNAKKRIRRLSYIDL